MNRSFNEVAKEVHELAVKNGWWAEERSHGEIIALIHSELSEALEALRKGDPLDDHIDGFTAVEVELADVIIRIMDYAEGYRYHVWEAVLEKHEYNKTRPYKHGKRF